MSSLLKPVSVAASDRSLILTTYFHAQPDPIRKTYVDADRIEYISSWYDSLHRLNLNGVVFHDGLSPSFVERHQTARIRFVYVDPATFTHSLNDYRFVIYLDFLRQHPAVESVFMTDGNDVTVVQDPFPSLRPGRLYVGSEPGDIKENRFVRRRIWLMNQGLGREAFRLRRWLPYRIYNAGIVGGSYSTCVRFLERLVETLDALDREHRSLNLNMAVFNYTVYRYFRGRVETGAPVHSVFKQYENDRKDVWFVHK